VCMYERNDSLCVWVKTSQLQRPLPSSRYAPSICQCQRRRREEAMRVQLSDRQTGSSACICPPSSVQGTAATAVCRTGRDAGPPAGRSGLTWYADVAAPKRNPGGNSLRSTPRTAGARSATSTTAASAAAAAATALAVAIPGRAGLVLAAPSLQSTLALSPSLFAQQSASHPTYVTAPDVTLNASFCCCCVLKPLATSSDKIGSASARATRASTLRFH
jgi:hypothetical protein